MIEIPEPLVPPSTAVITITCDRDRWTFARQYQTMIRLCLPTDWFIFVNESQPSNWYQWYQESIKGMGQGRLRIHVLDSKDLPYKDQLQAWPGYWSQQFYKMLLASEIDRDIVIVLDSKNWLIKPWHPLMHRVPPRQPLSVGCEHFAKTWNFARKQGVKAPDLYRSIMPPVAWEPQKVRSALAQQGNFEHFLNKISVYFEFENVGQWGKKKFNHIGLSTFSEFMFYDLCDQRRHILPQETAVNYHQNCCQLWDYNDFEWTVLDNQLAEPNHYWFTIKWHHYDGPPELKDQIWARIERELMSRDPGSWSG